MKIRILKKDFLKSLENVGMVINKSSTESVLKDVLLKDDNGKIVLVGTNLEQGVEVILNGEVRADETRESLLPFELLKKAVKMLKTGEIEIDAIERKAIIRQGDSECVLDTFDPEAFAILPKVEGKIITIKRDVLKELINSVLFATARKDDARVQFKGVLFNVENGTLELAATDGVCLAIDNYPLLSDIKTSFIVPWKTLDILKRAKTDDEEVNIIWNENYIKFSFPSISILSFLIKGNFPPYREVFPKQYEAFIHVNKKEILSALKRILVFSNEKVKIDFNDNYLEIKGKSEDGEWKEKVECEGVANLSISFDIERLIKGISHTPGERIVFEINDSLHPVIIQGNGNYAFVIMPRED